MNQPIQTFSSQTNQCPNASQNIQYIIISISLFCCFYTMGKITLNKLFHNQFAFLIFSAQLCFALIGIIDLASKLFEDNKDNSNSKLWCQIVTPFVYGLILSTFLFIQLFCVILYRRVMRIKNSMLDKNIKLNCFCIAAFNIAINYFGFPYFQFGFCRNCTFEPKDEALSYLMKIITYIDYFLPLVLMIYVIWLVIQINKHFRSNPEEKRLFKILIIPLGNAIVLILNNVVSSEFIHLENSNPIVHVLLYQSLYYVPLVNMFFYYFFVKSFELEEEKLKKKRKKSNHSLLMSYIDTTDKDSPYTTIGFRF